MTTTPDLVESLVGDLAASPKAWMARRLALGFMGGAVVTAAISFGLWGPRPDLASAAGTWPFWVKFAYTGTLALSGLVAVDRLGRPDGRGRVAPTVATAAFVVLAGLAALQLAEARVA